MNLAWVELWLFQFPSVSLHNRLEDFWYPQVIHMITTWIESSSKEFIHVGVGPIRPSMKIIRGTSPSPVCCVPIHPLNFASPAGDLPPRDFASPPGSLRPPRSPPLPRRSQSENAAPRPKARPRRNQSEHTQASAPRPGARRPDRRAARQRLRHASSRVTAKYRLQIEPADLTAGRASGNKLSNRSSPRNRGSSRNRTLSRNRSSSRNPSVARNRSSSKTTKLINKPKLIKKAKLIQKPKLITGGDGFQGSKLRGGGSQGPQGRGSQGPQKFRRASCCSCPGEWDLKGPGELRSSVS